MDFDQDYKIIGVFDVSSIRRIIEGFDQEWTQDLDRQTTYEKHHGSTQNIFITDIRADWDGHGDHVSHRAGHAELADLTRKIIQALENLLDGHVGKSVYIRLPAGAEVKPHVDQGRYLENVHRCHIPITTSDQVLFTVGESAVNMRPGLCYEINNCRWHSVSNPGSTHRVHLMIDIIPRELLDSLKKD